MSRHLLADSDSDNHREAIERLQIHLEVAWKLIDITRLNNGMALVRSCPVVQLKYGLELAERGYVVLVTEHPSFGEHRHDYQKNPAYASGTMKVI